MQQEDVTFLFEVVSKNDALNVELQEVLNETICMAICRQPEMFLKQLSKTNLDLRNKVYEELNNPISDLFDKRKIVVIVKPFQNSFPGEVREIIGALLCESKCECHAD